MNIYCATAVYRADTLDHGLLGDATLQINLAPSRGRLPILEAKAKQEIAGELQPKLLAYRSRNIARVRESEFDLPGLASEIRILARILGACFVDAPELQAGLGPLLEEHNEKIRAEHWIDLHSVAIEALLFHCHSGEKELVYVGEITRTACTILKGRGESTPLKPRAMGPILRSLGLSPKRVTKGFIIQLADGVRRRIHRLARDYDVAAVQEGVARCPHCSEIAAAREPRGEPTSEEQE